MDLGWERSRAQVERTSELAAVAALAWRKESRPAVARRTERAAAPGRWSRRRRRDRTAAVDRPQAWRVAWRRGSRSPAAGRPASLSKARPLLALAQPVRRTSASSGRVFRTEPVVRESEIERVVPGVALPAAIVGRRLADTIAELFP